MVPLQGLLCEFIVGPILDMGAYAFAAAIAVDETVILLMLSLHHC